MRRYNRCQRSPTKLWTWYAAPWIITSWGSEVVFAYKCAHSHWLMVDHWLAYVIRNTLHRRSSRLNPGSCEMSEVSSETLHVATVVPSSSSFSVPEIHEPDSEKDLVRYCFCFVFQQLRFNMVVVVLDTCYIFWYDVQQKARQGKTAGLEVKTPAIYVNWFQC